MITELLTAHPGWTWLCFGLLLLVGEILLPGFFLMWIGLAGAVVGLLSFFPLFEEPFWSWHVQLVVFGVLAVAFVLIGQRVWPSNRRDDDAAQINDPLSRYVGTETELVEAIESGSGRVKLGDTTWRVQGPALPVGSRVKVVGSLDGALLVSPV